MKQKLSLLFGVFAMSLLFSCSKSDSDAPATPKYANISSVSPDKWYTGKEVTVIGNNFGTDTSKIHVVLVSSRMVITAMTNTSITFIIPADFIKSGSQDCTLEVDQVREEGLYGVQRQVMVYFLEPKGWFYAANLPATGNNPLFKNLIFPTDSIGYAQKEKSLYRTTDGGVSWKGDMNNGGFGLGYAVASSDGLNTWLEFAAEVAVSANGTSWVLGPEGRNFNSLIVGLYTTGAANGLVATVEGRLYDVNGSWTNATMKYQSAAYTTGTFGLFGKMSVVDKNNLMIAGANNTMIVEKAGVFSEVDITSVSNAPSAKDLQLVDANTAFLVNGNYELIKYAGNTWTKLTQKANAVYFISTTTGYIAYDNKVLKTTDGGATWTEQFTLKTGEKVVAIAARNGKVWLLGNDATQGFVLKYNP